MLFSTLVVETGLKSSVTCVAKSVNNRLSARFSASLSETTQHLPFAFSATVISLNRFFIHAKIKLSFSEQLCFSSVVALPPTKNVSTYKSLVILNLINKNFLHETTVVL